MKEIKLTQGKVALVDDEDFEYLNQWKWHARRGNCGYTFYAGRQVRVFANKQKLIHLHVAILGNPQKGMVCDHIDGNGLNNQRINLRYVTIRQNTQNNVHRVKSSKYTGVSWDKKNLKWQSKIAVNGKCKALGRYVLEEEAFNVYRQAVESIGEMVVERCQNY